MNIYFVWLSIATYVLYRTAVSRLLQFLILRIHQDHFVFGGVKHELLQFPNCVEHPCMCFSERQWYRSTLHTC